MKTAGVAMVTVNVQIVEFKTPNNVAYVDLETADQSQSKNQVGAVLPLHILTSPVIVGEINHTGCQFARK